MDNALKSKSQEELWQESEDERLEYEGYCRKIIQGLENQSDMSGIRAIWELVQNARDLSKHAVIKIELTRWSLIFSHHGTPFDYTSFRALVKQDSSKDRADADIVGQYGTGFMTTHTFNRLVYVSAPFAVRRSKEEISGYVQIKDFELDRRKVDTVEGPGLMKKQLEEVKGLWKRPQQSYVSNDTTSFRYDLDEQQVEKVSSYLECVVRLLPFVLLLNDTIKKIEVEDKYSNRHFTIQKVSEETPIKLDQDGWEETKETISLLNHTTGKDETVDCKSLKSSKGDVVIIPPYPELCGDVKDIPSLFLWFPLLGTENFGVNFIFHSKRFYPVEKRNNIMLPGASQISKEKGGDNEQILKEMMTVLFEYYKDENHAKELSLNMCRVAFPAACENEETQRFYEEMQQLWNKRIPSWKVIPVGEEKVSIEDNRVRLLHPSFYNKLEIEKRAQYEPVMAQYVCLVKIGDNPILIPNSNLIAWSEMVNRWQCNRDSEFFVTVAEVCKAIKENGDNLFTFLSFLKDSGNEKLMEENPLLPNRKGDLCLRNSLYYGEFMTDEVYELVKVLLGDAVGKIYDPEFLKVSTVNPYTIENLRRDITNTLSAWRKETIDHQPVGALDETKLDALIQFCSASCMDDFTNQRGRLMRLLVKFYQKEFKMESTIRFLENNEEDFYKPAFFFLIDYTLSQIGQKDAAWVETNKDWLLQFLREYAPNENDDKRKKLDTYGVLPNRNNVLCLKNDLKACKDVPEEIVEIYQEVFKKDLREEWINPMFDEIVPLKPVYAKEIANEIETTLVADMKQDTGHTFEKIIRKIILKVGESTEWKDWFGQIDDKKATYTFSMQSGKAQKSLFSLMDNLDEDQIERLAKLGEDSDVDGLLDKMERLQQLEHDRKARFYHLHTIGKHIEEILRETIGQDCIKADMPENEGDVLEVDDIQDGQDIVVSVKKNGEWKEIYYVEVKSKWDFSIEPAHMSTRQVRMASLHPDIYTLCCVDLRPYKDEDLATLPKEKVLGATNVKMEIGKTLRPMMTGILNAEAQSDDYIIKISEYRSNIPAKVFEVGEPFDALIRKIETIARNELAS